MKTNQLQIRDSFRTKWGFIISSVGSAVGMANVWAFPYRTAKYGGAAFLIPYIICVILLAYTGVVEETAFGRWGRSGPLGTFRKALTRADKPLKDIGIIPVVGAFCIGTGYAIIMGWVLRYLWGSVTGRMIAAENTGAYFGAITGSFGSIGWHAAALAITFIMMAAGISRSIEKINKVVMPLFFLLFIYMGIRVAAIPGASVGYKYLFIPRWEFLGDIKTWIFALGQAFFSLSIAGFGALVYGSYLDDKVDVVFCSLNIAIFDTLAAVLAALVVIPAVFAFGFDPASGPPLMFITLPAIFQEMGGGYAFSIIFFLAILSAAASSIVNIFEAPIEMLQQRFRFGRRKAVGTVVALSFAVGAFIENANIIGGWMDMMSIYICPLGALIAAFIFFWLSGGDFAYREIQKGRLKPVGRWIVPLGKYVFCAISLLVLILGIALEGIG